MIEACIILLIIMFIGIILGLVEVWYDKVKKKSKNVLSYKKYDFINRFETESWELRS